LAGWWAEHFLAQNSRSAFPPELLFQVMPDQPENKIDFLETSYKKRATGTSLLASFHISWVNHTLGRAFKAATVINLPPRGTQRPQRMRTCMFMIALNEPRLKRRTLISIRYFGPDGAFPGGDARLEEIFRRIHIVSTIGSAIK
jgi:hypothetical protein